MDSSAMDFSVDGFTVKYQWTIANRLSTTCPAASRFYLSNLEKKLIDEPKLLKKDVKRSFLYCKHCGNLWSPGNHKVRVRPPPTIKGHIKKLLKCEAEQPWRLNNRQKKKLKMFKESTGKIVYVCNICKKSTTFPGEKKTNTNNKNVSFNAPVPKIISKKGDLNAGLFIKIPDQKIISEPQEENDSLNQSGSKTSEMLTPESTKLDIKIKNKPFLAQRLSMQNNAVKSSNKKKKKDLMAQILNQEQDLKKKKNSLSSFLVSL